MSQQSIHDLDLAPNKPGKQYWVNGGREWHEEVISFPLVDRFHDNHTRSPLQTNGKTTSFGTQQQLQRSCGGMYEAS
jgi:hypothetical protein